MFFSSLFCFFTPLTVGVSRVRIQLHCCLRAAAISLYWSYAEFIMMSQESWPLLFFNFPLCFPPRINYYCRRWLIKSAIHPNFPGTRRRTCRFVLANGTSLLTRSPLRPRQKVHRRYLTSGEEHTGEFLLTAQSADTKVLSLASRTERRPKTVEESAAGRASWASAT